MKIDSVSYGVASKVVKTFAMEVTRIRGYKTAANDRWLQVFDAKKLPADSTVPKRSYPIYGTAPFDIMVELAPINFLNGCVFAVSSTEATLTASAETVDLFISGVTSVDDTGWTTVGDYTTGVYTRDLWLNASGPKMLTRVEFTTLSHYASVLYAKFFGSDVLVAGDLPFMQLSLAVDASADFFFETIPQWTKANVFYQGCTIVIDATPGPLALDNVGTNFAIKGTYV